MSKPYTHNHSNPSNQRTRRSFPQFEAYLSAGYNAFRAAFSRGYFGAPQKPEKAASPYGDEPAADIWRRGWNEAEAEFDRGIPFRYNALKGVEAVKFHRWFEYLEARQKHKTNAPKVQQQRQQQTVQFRQKLKHTKWPKTQPTPTGPAKVTSLKKLENKFNKRYQTVA